MCAQEDTENRRFNDNVALSRGIKEFIALAAGQQMRIEHHDRTAQQCLGGLSTSGQNYDISGSSRAYGAQPQGSGAFGRANAMARNRASLWDERAGGSGCRAIEKNAEI